MAAVLVQARKGLCVAGIGLAAGALLLIYLAPFGQASNNASYRGYATCNVDQAKPDRVCAFGSGFGAVFVAKKRDHVHYRLCVVNRQTDKVACFRKETDNAGVKSVIPLFRKPIVSSTGEYRLKWRTGGNIVARDTLTMTAGD